VLSQQQAASSSQANQSRLPSITHLLSPSKTLPCVPPQPYHQTTKNCKRIFSPTFTIERLMLFWFGGPARMPTHNSHLPPSFLCAAAYSLRVCLLAS